MAVKETDMRKDRAYKQAKDRSHDLFMDVAFAPTHGLGPVADTNWEKGPSKAGLVLGLANTGWQGYQDFQANTTKGMG